MKKMLACLLILCLISAIICACGKDAGELTDSEATTVASGTVGDGDTTSDTVGDDESSDITSDSDDTSADESSSDVIDEPAGSSGDDNDDTVKAPSDWFTPTED